MLMARHAAQNEAASRTGDGARSEVCVWDHTLKHVYLRAPACHASRLWFLIHIPPLVLFHTRMSSSALPIGFFQFFSKSADTCGRKGAKWATFGRG
jgi:hypothetical protein